MQHHEPERSYRGDAITPTISAYAQADQYSEEATLLTLYALAGEESGTFISFRPRIFHQIQKSFLAHGSVSVTLPAIDTVDVRELSTVEMARAEKELWIHYHQQKADVHTDRLFAAFGGNRLIGVARCSRHPDGLEVDGVYVLDEYRRHGFARSIMRSLIEECGRHETLYMHSKIELMDFYGDLGFRQIPEIDLPKSIRDRFAFVLGELKGIDVCPMKRVPSAGIDDQNT